MAKAVHMMVRVLDMDRSIAFYEQAFGLGVANRFDFDSFELVYLRNEATPFEVELTSNKDRAEAYDLGDGYGHVAFTVDDLEAEHKRMQGAGVAVGDVKSLEHGGRTLAKFFFVTDPDGYKIEVIQRGGRYA